MNENTIKFIIAKIIDNANDAREEYLENKSDDFYKGKNSAYYEILDAIKNELIVNGQDLKEFGLDINLEKEFL